MLQNLSEQVRDCVRHADDCAQSAKRERNPNLQLDFLAMEHRWLGLARSYQFLEQLGLFMAHSKGRRAELSRRLERLNGLLKDERFNVIDGGHRDEAPRRDGSALPMTFGAMTAPTRAKSRLEMQAAQIAASEPSSIRLVEICAIAGVQLLRYPVSAERQVGGQTMAIAAISNCLKRYGQDTLITALQCITQTTNNKPGALTARIIKALCALLAHDSALRESGLALFERFDHIDLIALSNEATTKAAAIKIDAVQALVARLMRELDAPIVQPRAPDSDCRAPLAPK